MTSNRPPKEPFDGLAKVAVIGDTSVGKTNLLLRFVSQEYHMSHISTIGIDFKVKSLQIDDFKLKLQIWDTAGQQRYRNLTGTVYQGAHGILLAYSITDRKTFENVERWMIDVKDHAPANTVVAIVANKVDMEAERVVNREQGAAIAEKYNAIFMETSAKENINVQKLFHAVGNKIKTVFFTDTIRKSTIKATEKVNQSSVSNITNKSDQSQSITKTKPVKLSEQKSIKKKKKQCEC